MTVNVIRTATREYRITHFIDIGAWSVTMRPLNKKTGKAWQGSRYADGANCYCLGSHKTGTRSGIVDGILPADWTDGGKWDAATRYWKTYEDARASCV